MGIQKGTKLTKNPKNNTFKLRLDEITMDKLEFFSEKQQISKADVIRKGIDVQFEQEK